MKETIGIKHY